MFSNLSRDTLRRIITIVIVSVICVLSIFFYNGKDCQDISNWAIKLLDSVEGMRVREFALICNDAGIPTNYSALSNIICGIWIIPIYIMDRIIDGSIPLVAFCTWVKTGVSILNVLSAFFLYKIINKQNKTIKMDTIFLLWFSFNLVAQYSIGNGQIDILGILILLLALWFYLNDRLIVFSLLCGLCLCFKIFPIIVIGLLFSYLFADKGIKIFNYLILLCIFPILQLTIEKAFFIDYDICERVGFKYSDANFIDRLFTHNWNISIAPVIMIFAVMCVLVYLLKKYDLIRVFDVLALASLFYCIFFIMVESHCQWYIYLLPIVILINMQEKLSVEFMLICLGFNISEIVYNSSSTDSVKNSLYGLLKDNANYFDYNILFEDIRHMPEYVASIFFAFMIMMVLYYLVVIIAKRKNKKNIRVQKESASMALLYVMSGITIISELTLVILY